MKGPRVTDRYGWRRCIICGQKWSRRWSTWAGRRLRPWKVREPVCEQHGKELGDVVREFIAHAQIEQSKARSAGPV